MCLPKAILQYLFIHRNQILKKNKKAKRKNKRKSYKPTLLKNYENPKKIKKLTLLYEIKTLLWCVKSSNPPPHPFYMQIWNNKLGREIRFINVLFIQKSFFPSLKFTHGKIFGRFDGKNERKGRFRFEKKKIKSRLPITSHRSWERKTGIPLYGFLFVFNWIAIIYGFFFLFFFYL